MNRWKSGVAVFALLLGGCQYDQTLTSVIERPALKGRPIVALLPVADLSRHDLSWNVSHELTESIRKHVSEHNRLYLISKDQIDEIQHKSAQRDPFGIETGWVKKAYPLNEFVAFFELVEHREIPLVNGEGSPAQLSVAMRVRVFDLRTEQATVVLQEIIEQSHHIPKQFTRNQFNEVPQASWGDEMFEISPLGIAHEKLCQELATRVEDYILLNFEKNL